ncbi:hypothetical protein MCHIJ_32270 [Mycolicibacterium chitae]|uniref:Transcriptional regulator, WhiB family n=1 Tax=Mycolicibacterium chitae TaxID=1792 RepID=A0A448I523_MYCCI|nr:hypothetical protein [Mycolicibacterium chitae]MCV7106295.1 hypothetical protein [Mycolicibacterium chitae]BBZ03790.1 hypothetical protein MCHIJ_32270 [Mycolicibacterium chitae]VEG47444.1 Putative transcriptional regulator, WhiB family [Mycolicibacterium chitae]
MPQPVDDIDWEIVEFVVNWAPFGGPDPEEALPRFGMSCEQIWARFTDIVDEVGRSDARLDRRRRELVRRARRVLGRADGGAPHRSSASDPADPLAISAPGHWVARRGVWYWR